MKVTFLAPSIGAAGTFYDIFVDFLRTAARQLQIELEVVDCTKHREVMLERGRAAVAASKKPDYMLLVNYMNVGQELLPENAAAGVGTFFVTEALSDRELRTQSTQGAKAGQGYLGQIVPDDVEAGKLLAEILTSRVHARGLVDAGEKVHVGVLAGEHTQAGNARFQGWSALKKERDDVIQAGLQYGSWEEETAKAVTSLMLRSTPQIRALWCANDAMALGALAAAVEAGRRPGQDLLIGGIDLVERALAEIAAGHFEVSVGGHLVDGVRALILLHDHHGKHDLVPEKRTTHLVAVKTGQADRYLKFMKGHAWRDVDFTCFSRLRNPKATDTDLSLERLISG